MKNEKGQSLFEIVVALAVSTLIIVAIVALASTSIRNSSYSRNNTVATRYAQQTMEWLRSERDINWNDFYAVASATPSWCMTELDWTISNAKPNCSDNEFIPDTFFYREVVFTAGTIDVSGVPKQYVDAFVKVYWVDSQGEHQVSSTTRFSDWRDLQR